MTTEFGLSAPGWIGDTSLMYDYFAINEMGVEEPLGGGAKTITMRIGTPGLWTIQVRVTDAFGAEGVASAGPLTIEETVLEASQATDMLADADTLAKGGSSKKTLALMSAIFSNINEGADSEADAGAPALI